MRDDANVSWWLMRPDIALASQPDPTLMTIFLIDDDPVFVFLLKEMISYTNEKAQIGTFEDGLQAISYLQANNDNPERLPDVIFLDLFMPVMDGWEFLEEYRRLAPEMKKKMDLYILSSSISPDDVERSKRYQEVMDYLVKPVGLDKMEIILKEQGRT
jgi:CheY-like chemotaxis protein